MLKRDKIDKPDLEWMDLRTLQQYADVSDKKLREWIHLPVNPLPAVQVEQGKILINRRQFDRWLEAHPYQSLNSIDLDKITNDILDEIQQVA